MEAAETETAHENLLSRDECSEIVKKALTDVELVSYEIVPASKDIVGYLGDYYKLNTVIRQSDEETTQNLSFFIKSLPLRNQVHREVITRLKFMDKETTLYSLFEKMRIYTNNKWHPDVYLYREDVLVLEDLMQFSFRHEKFNLNLPSSCTWPALKCLAAMHANSLVYEVKTGINIGNDYNHLFTRTITKGNTWVNSGLKSIYTLARMHPNLQSNEYQKFIEDHLAAEIEKVHELGTISKEFRNTLCHRDLWESNMLFKEDDQEKHCILIDFQVTRYIPPAIDVTLFLHMNADRENRKHNMDRYLHFYYEWLTKFAAEMDVNIDEHIPRAQFDLACEKFKLIPLVLTCVYAPIIYLPDFNILRNLNKADPVHFQHIMNGDRSDFAVEYVNKYPDYGKRVMEVVEELVEYLYQK